jgi:predicted transcriptional regulator
MSSPNPLLEWRTSKAYSVATAAAMCQVARTHWYKYELGALPQEGVATRIQAQTGVTRSQLMAWKEAQFPPPSAAQPPPPQAGRGQGVEVAS